MEDFSSVLKKIVEEEENQRKFLEAEKRRIEKSFEERGSREKDRGSREESREGFRELQKGNRWKAGEYKEEVPRRARLDSQGDNREGDKMSALIGKIGSLVSELLKDEDYEDLLSSTSVPEIAQKLRRTAYGDYIPEIEDIHRRDLEAAIQRRLSDEIARLSKYLTFPQKSSFHHMALRCEIETIKRVLRTLFAGEKVEERFTVCLPEGVNLSSLQDFVSSLSRRPYHGILTSVYGAEGGIGRMENSLDFWYFSELLKKLKLSGSSRVIAVFKEQVDLMNLMWVYRARVLFKYSPERTKNLLLPFGRRLKGNLLEELVSCGSAEEILQKVSNTPYRPYLEKAFGEMGEYLLERSMERYLYGKFSRMVRDYQRGFDMAVGYLHLLEYEMRNIVTVIEAVRYKLDRGIAKNYLIRG